MKRKQSSLPSKETKIKCYLFTPVQFKTMYELKVVILLEGAFHSFSYQIGPYISSNDSATIVRGSALKLYIKEIVLLKYLLMGIALARFAVRVIALQKKVLIFTEIDLL